MTIDTVAADKKGRHRARSMTMNAVASARDDAPTVANSSPSRRFDRLLVDPQVGGDLGVRLALHQALQQLALAMVAQRTMDEDVRVRWLRGPLGREMAALAGPIDTIVASDGRSDAPAEGNDLLLQSLVQGKTNAEIAGDLGIDEQAVERRLGELFATIGASSRADATAFAFMERVL